MGTLGGLELRGLIGIFIDPVALALAGAMLSDRTRDDGADPQVTRLAGTLAAASEQSTRQE
jgi:hypothetical protein